MSLHINKNRDNSSELEHDDLENLISSWFDTINNGTYVINKQARSYGKTETASNLIWQSFN